MWRMLAILFAITMQSTAPAIPKYQVDPAWPKPLPNHWLVGAVVGVAVDSHDHIWIYNRPRTLTNEEAGLEGPLPGVTDEKGSPSTVWVKRASTARSTIAAKPRPL